MARPLPEIFAVVGAMTEPLAGAVIFGGGTTNVTAISLKSDLPKGGPGTICPAPMNSVRCSGCEVSVNVHDQRPDGVTVTTHSPMSLKTCSSAPGMPVPARCRVGPSRVLPVRGEVIVGGAIGSRTVTSSADDKSDVRPPGAD